jgi:hypothetical protein
LFFVLRIKESYPVSLCVFVRRFSCDTLLLLYMDVVKFNQSQ